MTDSTSPVVGSGVAGPVGPVVGSGVRGAEEIRADVERWQDRYGDEPLERKVAAYRLADDVPSLLAEVERLRDIVAEFRLRDASQDRIRERLTVERDEARAALAASRGVVQAAESPEAIEAAAIALYEHSRDPSYTGAEWDWPNIDRSYDHDDPDNDDPEWLRNTLRADARIAVRAALAAAAVPTPQPATIYDEVRAERERAHAKHGDTSMESAPAGDPTGRRYRILAEEVGEVAQEWNDAEHDQRPVDLALVRKELIQVAAMAAAWADACSVAASLPAEDDPTMGGWLDPDDPDRPDAAPGRTAAAVPTQEVPDAAR